MATITSRRTFIRLATDTKANRLATAEFAARTWRSHSDIEGSARCTVCGLWIYAVRRLIGGDMETWANALTGAMFEHLDGECAVVTR
jgi:hypothetical protein